MHILVWRWGKWKGQGTSEREGCHHYEGGIHSSGHRPPAVVVLLLVLLLLQKGRGCCCCVCECSTCDLMLRKN